MYRTHVGDLKAISVRTGLRCLDPSRAVQSQKDEADINVIVRNFGVTGKLPQNVRIPQYADFQDAVDDYQTALHVVAEAEKSFNALPSEFRKRLDNDPQKFLAFCSDERNREEMSKLGLIVAPLPPVVPSGSEGS